MSDELKDLLLTGEDPKAVIRELQEDNAKLRDQLHLQEALQEQGSVVRIKPAKRKKGAHHAITADLASDWHCGEYVSLDLTNGLNEYKPDICKHRAERFFDYALWTVNLYRQDIDVDTHLLCLLGDILTGFIHEDQRRTNTLSPTEEVLFVKPILAAGIDHLLARGQFRRLIVPCIWGNHGRMNPNRELLTAGRQDSLEWMIYKDLERHYAGEDRIEFKIASGPVLYVVTDGFVLRLFHGNHQVSYNKGIGGVAVPLNRTLPRLDKGIRADYSVLGHWHQLGHGNQALINGSLIGYNGYAAAKGFAPEPAQQAAFIFDPGSKQILGTNPIFAESPDEWLKRQREVVG